MPYIFVLYFKLLNQYIKMDLIMKTTDRCFICNTKTIRSKLYFCVNTVDNTIKEIKNNKPVVCLKCVSNHKLK